MVFHAVGLEEPVFVWWDEVAFGSCACCTHDILFRRGVGLFLVFFQNLSPLISLKQ